ncbi:hypothetical protein HKX48_007875 [Thoreauomyces humboldtii]|nr:hypothetical protein HKX48_007875 [Thoreauomyces humboldtii]
MSLAAAAAPSLVCEEAILEGRIQLGKGNIVHPKCHLRSTGAGAIVIGDGNVLEEHVLISHTGDEPLRVGHNNVFQVGAVFRGMSVGTGCTIEVGAVVAEGTTIGDNCVIGAKCVTHVGQTVPDDTVIHGAQHDQRVQTRSNRLQANLHARHLEYLREVLPKYHHLRE